MARDARSRIMIPCYRPVLGASDLLAGHWPVGGRERFEEGIANHVGAKHALAAAYARLGLFISLKALGFRGAEIILPAFICANMAEAIVASGNQPVFVDINPEDYSMDLEAVAKAITPETRAVVATHMFGFYCDPKKIRDVTGTDGVMIIEDSAQRLPGTSGTKPEISSDIALFSFGKSKPICTIEGGLVATQHANLCERMRAIRDQEFGGRSFGSVVRNWLWWLASYVVYSRAAYGPWQRRQGPPKDPTGKASSLNQEIYQTRDAKFAEFQGRMGLNQLKRIDKMLARRRRLAEIYDRELECVVEVVRPPLLPDATYTYYTVRIPRRDERRFERKMWEEGVVVGRTYDYVVSELEPFRRFARGTYPNSRQAAEEVVNLPIHPGMRDEDISKVVETLKRVLRNM